MDNPLIIWALACFAAAVFLFLLEVFIPSGDTTFLPGDTLIIFFTKDARPNVESFFEF